MRHKSQVILIDKPGDFITGRARLMALCEHQHMIDAHIGPAVSDLELSLACRVQCQAVTFRRISSAPRVQALAKKFARNPKQGD